MGSAAGCATVSLRGPTRFPLVLGHTSCGARFSQRGIILFLSARRVKVLRSSFIRDQNKKKQWVKCSLAPTVTKGSTGKHQTSTKVKHRGRT